MKNQSFARRVRYAVGGIRAAWSSEASFRAQVLFGALAVVVLAALRPPALWIAACVLSAAAVFATELMNTALEHLADRLHPELHPAIRAAKDCAAAAVLVASVAAVVVGTMTVAVALKLMN